MRIKLITCVSFARTLVSAIARSNNIVHTEILDTDSLKKFAVCQDCNHKEPCNVNNGELNFHSCLCKQLLIELKVKLHSAIGNAEACGFNAILALFDQKCRDILSGIKANRIPIVIPRSFLCNNYQSDYHIDNHRFGEYIKTNRLPANSKISEVISLIEQINSIKTRTYGKTMEFFEFWEKLSEIEAEWFGWDFENMELEYLLLQKFVDGFWSYDEFIVLMPGDQLVIDSEIGNIALKKAH